jgi:hypothetical protein
VAPQIAELHCNEAHLHNKRKNVQPFVTWRTNFIFAPEFHLTLTLVRIGCISAGYIGFA